MPEAVSVNLPRISQNLRAFSLLNTLRGSQTRLFALQNQLATGLKFQRPSDNVTAAAATSRLDRRVDTLAVVGRNLNAANAVLGSGEDAMQAAVTLLREAHGLALEGVGDTLGADERGSLATVVESITDQLIAVANRKHLDSFLFSGRAARGNPFTRTDAGVRFSGDNGRLQTIVDSDLSSDSFTISGQEFFNAVSDSVRGDVDLNPALTPDTRLVDLRGATNSGVTPGRVRISDGTSETLVDLSGADTLGDVIDLLNGQLPDSLVAGLSGSAILISGTRAGVSITVEDDAGGATAVELGIIQPLPGGVVIGRDLNPRLTARSTLVSLMSGAGVDLSAGLTVTNGLQQAQIDLAGLTTIEEVLNRINQSDVGVRAEIAPDGDRLLLRNELSGTELRVAERGGTAAAALGIRTLQGGTLLSSLNNGAGVSTVAGNDFRITTASGATIDIDLDALPPATATIQGVLDLLNSAGGGLISATLSGSSGGIVIRDNTSGSGQLAVTKLNLSAAIDGLGLDAASSGGVLTGKDTNGITVESPFSALLALQRGLAGNDRDAINRAAAKLEAALTQMERVQGQLAAKANQMLVRANRVEDESAATQILLSDTRDVDITDAIVRFQQVQTALQANLQTASQVLNLSLLDYLR